MRIAGFEVGRQFGPADRRSPDFPDHDTGGMICQCRRLFHRGSAGARQGQGCNHGITGAGDIEHFALSKQVGGLIVGEGVGVGISRAAAAGEAVAGSGAEGGAAGGGSVRGGF